jgi:hypothetical protein
VHQQRPSEGACALRDEEEGQLLSRAIAVLLPLPCARALSRARLPPHGAPARDHDPRPTSTGLARARAELVGAGFSRDELLLHAQQQFSLCSSLWGETPLCASAPGRAPPSAPPPCPPWWLDAPCARGPAALSRRLVGGRGRRGGVLVAVGTESARARARRARWWCVRELGRRRDACDDDVGVGTSSRFVDVGAANGAVGDAPSSACVGVAGGVPAATGARGERAPSLHPVLLSPPSLQRHAHAHERANINAPASSPSSSPRRAPHKREQTNREREREKQRAQCAKSPPPSAALRALSQRQQKP